MGPAGRSGSPAGGPRRFRSGACRPRALRACLIRLSVIFRGRPPTLPRARAAASPAEVRSRMRSRSKLARAPKILKMILLPAVAVVSRSSRSVIVCSRCGRFRPSLSSRHTTRVSPSRRCENRPPSSGRDVVAPLGVSVQIREQPAARSASLCRLRVRDPRVAQKFADGALAGQGCSITYRQTTFRRRGCASGGSGRRSARRGIGVGSGGRTRHGCRAGRGGRSAFRCRACR